MDTGHHEYRIINVLGRGGYGTVYRARLHDGQGFAKDVALKLLSDPNPPHEVMQRFRDEARVLGLIRDRAVVQVAPPVRLGERWAVVMEFVEGTSLARVIKSAGTMPPTVALEIIAELGRALHRLWHQAGPDGSPLHLRHRDIKPANIQVTPEGTIKLLDFGIAKAEFEARESKTTSMMHGTHGYIAPERFYGEEGATTDVFSLGVVLHLMLHGRRPKAKLSTDAFDTSDPLGAATVLAIEMMSLDPDDRPTPRVAEERARTLLRQFQGPSLREWAEQVVPALATSEDDAMVGSVLTATMNQATDRRATWLAGGALGLSSLMLLGAGAVSIVTLLGVVLMVWSDPARSTASNPPSPQPSEVDAVLPKPASEVAPDQEAPDEEAPDQEATDGEEDLRDPEGALADADSEPEAEAGPDEAVDGGSEQVRPTEQPVPEERAPPTPAPVQKRPPPVAPRPRPAEPAPQPAPTTRAPKATHRVSLGSLPPDAVVRLDGEKVGITPLMLRIEGGQHQLRFELGDASIEQSIRVGERSPSRYLWRVSSGKVEAGY